MRYLVPNEGVVGSNPVIPIFLETFLPPIHEAVGY